MFDVNQHINMHFKLASMDHILASQPPLALKKQPGPYRFIYILSGTPLPAIGWGTQLLRRDSSCLTDFLTKQYAELALRYLSQEKSLSIQDESLINTRMPPFPMCIMLCQCIYGCGGVSYLPTKEQRTFFHILILVDLIQSS